MFLVWCCGCILTTAKMFNKNTKPKITTKQNCYPPVWGIRKTLITITYHLPHISDSVRQKILCPKDQTRKHKCNGIICNPVRNGRSIYWCWQKTMSEYKYWHSQPWSGVKTAKLAVLSKWEGWNIHFTLSSPNQWQQPITGIASSCM